VLLQFWHGQRRSSYAVCAFAVQARRQSQRATGKRLTKLCDLSLYTFLLTFKALNGCGDNVFRKFMYGHVNLSEL